MSTNYYAETTEWGVPQRVHLGKQSSGWQYLFRTPEGASTADALKEWLSIVKASRIFNEYNEEVSHAVFLSEIMLRQGAERHDAYDVQGFDFVDSDFI